MDRNLHSGKLFIISGPSGTGKGTICKQLIEGENIELSVSMTTRNPRPGEIEGKSYYFVTKEEFREEIEKGGFLEYAEVYGNYYGTPKQKVIDKLSAGIDVFLEIDIQGALNVKKAFPDGILIFILPPSLAILRQRITDRGSETKEAIDMRLSKTLDEVSFVNRYDYCVVNDNIDEAVNRVKSIISAEHSKVSESTYKLIEKYKEEV